MAPYLLLALKRQKRRQKGEGRKKGEGGNELYLHDFNVYSLIGMDEIDYMWCMNGLYYGGDESLSFRLFRVVVPALYFYAILDWRTSRREISGKEFLCAHQE